MFNFLKTTISCFAGYKNDFMVSHFMVEISSAQKSVQHNGFFTSTDVKGILEWKDYNVNDTAFLFMAASFDWATGYSAELTFTAMFSTY